jgi:hypothetical protein
LTRARALALILTVAALAGGCRGETQYIGTECVPSGTADDLQRALDVQSTVLLCPHALITLDKSVTLYGGLTMMTAGAPTKPEDMATIMLGPDYPDGMGTAVRGAGRDIHISSVRFDGNRRALGWRPSQIPVELGPGGSYTVDHCVFTDSAGWTHLHFQESCDSASVTNNVVLSRLRPHDDTGHWTDGFSISCAHTEIANNEINDISAVGIVYFGGPGSTIHDNVITEMITSAFSGINVGDAIVPDNTGVRVENNRVVAVSPRYFSEGIAAGLHVLGKTTTVSGVSFLGNTVQGMSRYGLVDDGCLDCTVTGNDVSGWHPLPPLAGCPAPAAYVAAVTAMHATGTLQGSYEDAKADNCPGEAEVLGPIYRVYAGDYRFPDYFAPEVATFSQRMEAKQDAVGLLQMEWDAIAARAKAICPMGTPADLQSIWRRLTDAQFGGGLSETAADAAVRMDLTNAAPGTPCSPPAPAP